MSARSLTRQAYQAATVLVKALKAYPDWMTYQATTEEHDGDGDVLEILCVPLPAPGAEMLKEDITRTIQEDYERLGEFARGNARSDGSHLRLGRPQVPRPAKVGKAPHPSTESEQSIPKEDSALDEVCEAVEDMVPALGKR